MRRRRFHSRIFMFVCTLCLASAATTVTRAQTCLPSPDGLVNWWPGDGTAVDIQGSADGNRVGGVSFVAGEVGQAFNLDGVSGLLDFGNTAGNFGSADFSIGFWIRTATNSLQSVMGKRPTCDHSSFIDIRMGAAGPGRLGFEIDQDAGGTNYNIVNATTPVNDGRWHCVVLTRHASTATIHVDGVADAVGSTPGITDIFNDSPWIIGQSTCTGLDGTSYFGGDMDEILVFDRALSESEIEAICSAGSAGICKDEDGDGFRSPLDCDETDDSIHPGAIELPGNFVDENCDGDLGACNPCLSWRNHGEYVRCVGHDVDGLVTGGSITQDEGDALVGSAAASDIGKRGFTPPRCE